MAIFASKKAKEAVGRMWWETLVLGILAVLFGLVALLWPGATLVTLVVIFAIFLLVSGIATQVSAVMAVGRGGWMWLLGLLLGILEVVLGVYLLSHPEIAIGTLTVIAAIIFLVQGVVHFVAVFTEKFVTATQRTLQVVSAILSLLVGIVLLVWPIDSTVALVWVFGLFALIYGPVLIGASIDMKHLTAKK